MQEENEVSLCSIQRENITHLSSFLSTFIITHFLYMETKTAVRPQGMVASTAMTLALYHETRDMKNAEKEPLSQEGTYLLPYPCPVTDRPLFVQPARGQTSAAVVPNKASEGQYSLGSQKRNGLESAGAGVEKLFSAGFSSPTSKSL